MSAVATLALTASAPLYAEDEQTTVIDGRCQYPDRVAEYRNETTLILCDTATITQSATITTLDFSQRSWGSTARFTGNRTGDTIAISTVALRGGSPVAARGSCEIFHRDDGRLSVISCLVKAGSRSIAANFVPSRL